ncbi:MAG: hypothetical protein ACJARJ_000001 [Neptuniibacter pectenicola]|jgi:hypothetical protein
MSINRRNLLKTGATLGIAGAFGLGSRGLGTQQNQYKSKDSHYRWWGRRTRPIKQTTPLF